MNFAEIADYWWILPLLMILFCCLSCRTGFRCARRRNAERDGRNTEHNS